MKNMSLLLAMGFLLSTFNTYALIPAGGERWVAGQSYTITWDAGDFGSGVIDISLWDGTAGEWYAVASSLPAVAGRFQWRIPQGLHGDFFRIRIQSRERPDNYKMSQSFFFITSSAGGGAGGNIPGLPSTSIRITPNPASENTVISWQADARQVIIRDLLGRKIREDVVDSSTRSIDIPIAGWLEGMYIIEVRLFYGEVVYGRLLVMP